MTVEVDIGISMNGSYNSIDYQLFEMAEYFSGSSLFSIIDSYSSTTGRYKGDPISSATWTSQSDIAQYDNPWFIIKSLTSPTTPQWECKIQGHSSETGFTDPSGIDYGSEGSGRIVRFRFAPYGGWTLADVNPDFVGPSSESSGNNKGYYLSHTGSGNPMKNYIIADDGQLAMFTMDMDTNLFVHFRLYMGDITPVDDSSQSMPRIHFNITNNSFCSPNTIGDNTGLPEGSYYNEEPNGGSIEYEDQNGDWITSSSSFRLPGGNTILDAYTQPNMYSETPSFDILPYTPLIDTIGFIGEIPILGKTSGVGNGALFGDKEWISFGDSYCIVAKWDGSTPVR
jgi:hypothetical protein